MTRERWQCQILFALVAIVLMPPCAQAAGSKEQVIYSIRPVFNRTRLAQVEISVSLVASSNGRTLVDLPDRYGGVADHWRYLTDVRVRGGQIFAPSVKQRLIISKPGQSLRITYRVSSAYSRDPEAVGGNPYEGAIIRPTWFSALGDFLFVTPHERGTSRARLVWLDWPSNWIKQATTDGKRATVDQVVESSLIAGSDVQVRRRPVIGGELRLVTRGNFSWSYDRYADEVARVVSAQRAFWRDQTGDYTVTLFPLAPSPGLSSIGGTGRSFGFVQYASPDSDFAMLFRIIAHEHAHTWIPNRLGRSIDEAPAEVFWLSEGFTDFYTAQSLLRSGLWTQQQFADDLNRTLAGLASSPARNYPNKRIISDFWTDPAVGQLPYDRGHLFALLLDYELTKRTGKSLDEVLLAMRNRWEAAPASAKPLLIDNLLNETDRAGFDVRPMIAKYITAGQTIVLPSDALRSCAVIENARVPSFAWGFDREASARDGLFRGVDPDGKAFAAGLRDGMKRLARLGGQEGNSGVPLSYRVSDGQNERTISWLPAGKDEISIQRVNMNACASAQSVTGRP